MYRLSGSDASMLYLETASQSLNGCGIWELDTSTMPDGYSFGTFRDKLAARLAAVPEFRMKLVDGLLNPDTPVWVEDSDFELDRHLHRVQLSAPAGRHELSDFVGQVLAARTDFSRPLWDMWVIEGLSDDDPDFAGPVAVVLRLHHVLGDGVAVGDMLSRLCSTEIEPLTPEAAVVVRTSNRKLAWDGLWRSIYRPWLAATVVLPATLLAVVRTILRTTRRQAMSGVFVAPPTPFNGNITDQRSTAFVQLDMREVNEVRAKFGITLNDVVLATVSGALRTLLVSCGALPEAPLVAMVPISARAPGRKGRNQVSVMFSKLRTDLADPAARLKATVAATSVAKEHSAAIGQMLMQDWLDCAPKLSGLVMRLYGWSKLSRRYPMCNLIVTNVRRPNVQYYLLGATVRARYAFAPVFHGAGLSFDAVTLGGKLTVGIVSCSDLLPDLWDLASGMKVALKELAETVS